MGLLGGDSLIPKCVICGKEISTDQYLECLGKCNDCKDKEHRLYCHFCKMDTPHEVGLSALRHDTHYWSKCKICRTETERVKPK